MSNALDRVKQEAIESITPSVGEYIGTTPRSSKPAQPTPSKLPDLPELDQVEGPPMPPTPDVEVADVVAPPSPVINPSVIDVPEQGTADYNRAVNLPPTPGTPESGLTFSPPEQEPSWVGLARGLQQSQYTSEQGKIPADLGIGSVIMNPEQYNLDSRVIELSTKPRLTDEELDSLTRIARTLAQAETNAATVQYNTLFQEREQLIQYQLAVGEQGLIIEVNGNPVINNEFFNQLVPLTLLMPLCILLLHRLLKVK